MSPNPTRDTTAGQVFNDLRNLARRQGRSTDELMIFYVLERFLFRVSRSPYADRLVLKGGLLLAAFDARRSTRDADLLASHLAQDETQVVAWVSEVAAIEVDDGVIFQTNQARTRSIRETDQYAGVRITMPSKSGRRVRAFRWTSTSATPSRPAQRTRRTHNCSTRPPSACSATPCRP